MESVEHPLLAELYEKVFDQATFGNHDDVAALLERAKGMALIDELHADDPDYFFARASLAAVACTERRLDEAHALLAPLSTIKELHITEYPTFMLAMVPLLVAMGNLNACREFCEFP